MKRLALQIAIIISGMVLLSTASCKTGSNYSEEVKVLDSLHQEVVRSEAMFNEVDRDRCISIIDTVKGDIDFLQSNYEGEMSKERALLIANYRGASRQVKDFEKRYNRINTEIVRTKSQLEALTKALKEGADQDSQGNEFTPDYVSKVFLEEKTVASSLIGEIQKMHDGIERMENDYANLRPQMIPILDSVKTTLE